MGGVVPTSLVGTEEEVALGWRSQQGAADQCAVRLVLTRSLFLFPDMIYSRNQMLKMGKDLVEIGEDFLAPCSALAPPYCDCFNPVGSLAWLEVEAGTDVFVGAQKLHVLGVEGPPRSVLVPSVAPG